MTPLVWAILLLALALLLILLEAFIPSGGVLGFLAAIALVASLVVGFLGGMKSGAINLVLATVVVPAAIYTLVKLWPSTPMGRMILGESPECDEDILPDSTLELRTLVGRHGVARTTMLPSGAIEIDGITYNAVSTGMPIDKGQAVEIAAVRTNQLIVRPASGSPPPPRDPQTAEDVLSQPIDALGLDALDDPLA